MLQRLIKQRWFEVLLSTVVAIGLMWRLCFYFWDVSLWHDELLLALNIVERGPIELMGPLDYNQAAPLLFLLVVECFTLLFGDAEWVLRLLPCLSGCMAVVWMAYFGWKYLDRGVALFACGLIAFANPLTMYTVQFKQYSGDLLASVIALHLFTLVPKSSRRGVACALLIMLLPWFSFSSIFVIAGLTGGYGLFYFFQKDRDQVVRVATLGLVGGLSFIVYYYFLIRPMSANQELVDFWQDFYFWEPWLSGRNYQLFQAGMFYIVKIHSVGTMLMLFVAALIGLWKQPKITLPCLMVLLVTVVASAMHKYPFCERLIVFLFPFVAIVLGQWFVLLARMERVTRLLAALTVIGLFLIHYPKNWKYLLNSPVYQEVRESFSYVEENRVAGDHVYLVPPFDRMGIYYDDYTLVSDASVLGSLSDGLLLKSISQNAPFWVLSEARRADQSEFLIQVVDRVEALAEEFGGDDHYDLFYIEFERTMLLYFKPKSAQEGSL